MSSPAPQHDHTDAAGAPMMQPERQRRLAHIERSLEWKRDMLTRANGEYALELEQDIRILESDLRWWRNLGY